MIIKLPSTRITLTNCSTKWSFLQIVLGVFLLLGATVSSQAQCGLYQNYESVVRSGVMTGWTLGGGGNWSFPSNSGAAPRSGSACILQSSSTSGGSIITPNIATPKTFSFWVKASVTVPYSVSFSDDNKTTWTNIPNGTNSVSTTLNPTPFSITASIPIANTTWQLVTLTASFPASANGYYFRIFDNRTSGTASNFYIDDISWVSSVDTDNTIVVPQLGTTTCGVTVPAGSVYNFYDVGGKNDYYSNAQTNIVTFTPANSGDKIKITFLMGPSLADANDKIFIYDSTDAIANSITGSPFTNASSSFPTYTSSLSSNGSITFKFVSNGTYAQAAITSMSDGFSFKVECTGSICQLPTTTPTVSNITSTTATFNWTGISPGYEYAITNSTTQPTGAGTYTTATTATLTGLTPNTYYYGWVRSKCGPTFYSNWVAVGWFQTQCTPEVLPYVENFDGLDFFLPTCTTSDPNGDWQTTIATNNMYATIPTYFFYSKPVTLSAATTYTLSYDYEATGGTADFDVYIGLTNDPSIKIPANKLISHIGVGALTHYSFNFTTTAAGNYYIGIYLNSTSVPLTTKLIIDNLVLDCATPVVTASTTTVCSSNDIITFSGSGVTGYTWSATAGNFYTDAAATIPYVPLSSVQTIYFRTNYNATVTMTGINGGCNKTATSAIQVLSTKWNGTAWDNGLPNSSKQVIFNGNYTSNNLVSPGDISACSVIVQSGTVLFKAGHSLIAQNSVTVSGGSLTFEDTASLVQTNNVTNATGVYSGGNSGTITYQRTTMPLTRTDYTYWSTPVDGQTLLALSPNTPSDKVYYFDAAVTNYWVPASTSSVMTPGTGYIVRAPLTFDLVTAQLYNASFIGVPNNGTITTPIVSGRFNLIGNPYPSALDIDKFLISGLNSGVVEGTIYLWTHNTPLTGNQYSSNDYAVYNYLGGTGTSAAPSGSLGGFNNNIPNGKIASGQSFFIKGLANGVATFRNSMRVAGNNNQFFRSSSTNFPVVRNNSRIWLDISNSQGAFKQILVGYSREATLGLDRGYDGEFYNFGSSVSFYSLSDATTLAIQGRPLPFDDSDEVSLGFAVTTAGTYTIKLSNFDGLFVNQRVYLKDVLLNTIIDLKQGSYTFKTDSGTFNNRFVVVYKKPSSNFDDADKQIREDNIVLFRPDHQLHVDGGTTTMEKIRVLDLNGRVLLEKENINSNEAVIDINEKGVFVIEITSQLGEVIRKKYLL